MQTLLAGQMRDGFDACADAAAIGFCADGFDFDPIVAGARIAAQKLGKIVDGVDDDVEIAVVVEVAEGAAARGDGRRDAGTGVVGNVVEAAVAEIFVKQLALRVAGFGLELLDLGIDVAVAEEDVRPAVVVHVKKTAAPAEILGVLAEAAQVGGVLEIRAAEIVIKRRGIASEIRFDEIEIAVEIVIGGGDAHAGLRLAVGAESAARFDGDVGESAVFFVLIERAGRGIVGDVNVRPAVVVEIGGEHAEAEGAVGLQDAGFFADVGEGAVAVVVVENVFSAVGDEEIVETVVIVVADADTLSPAEMQQAGFGGDVGERAIAIVLEEMICGFLACGETFEAPAVDEKNIQPAVVVVIVERDAAAGGFEKILVLVLAAEDGFGVEAGFARYVEKGNAEI